MDHAKEWFEEYYHMTGQDFYGQQTWEQPATLATSPDLGDLGTVGPSLLKSWPKKGV